jgi:hypothetical protein
MRLLRSRIGPWLGLMIAAVTWALHHQLGSHAAFGHCLPGQGEFTAMAGLGLVAVNALAAWISYRAGSLSLSSGLAQTRRFGGILSLCGGAVFSLAILFQTAAALIVPLCLA